MGLAKLVFVLIILQGITSSIPQRAAADDFLSPLFAPVFNGICSHVQCGKGNCKGSMNYTFGFVCECDAGWSQFHVEDSLRFLPCIIPNCSINYSCSNSSEVPAPAPSPSTNNFSIFDPCMWSYCGGGRCVKTSDVNHKCECNEGFGNLLNVTTFPCYKECSLGGDCANLGITVSNSSTSPLAPPTSLSDNENGSAGDSASPNSLFKILLMVSLVMLQVIY
ncbi:uncharacterized protein [Typha angustifolia]|uniref:uncharacterized protein n=1 Tax=Typha angustifolia TaxID=59011 RepID=UPI003C30E5E4